MEESTKPVFYSSSSSPFASSYSTEQGFAGQNSSKQQQRHFLCLHLTPPPLAFDLSEPCSLNRESIPFYPISPTRSAVKNILSRCFPLPNSEISYKFKSSVHCVPVSLLNILKYIFFKGWKRRQWSHWCKRRKRRTKWRVFSDRTSWTTWKTRINRKSCKLRNGNICVYPFRIILEGTRKRQASGLLELYKKLHAKH